MSVFLLVLGVLTTAAGLALVGAGLTIHDGAFDTDVITPGTIAAVGGLILVGIGLAVHELRRIERALAARPMPRPARPGEAPGMPVAGVAEPPEPAVRIPIPPAPQTAPGPPPLPGARVRPVLAEDAAIERLRSKFPTLARLDSAPVLDGADVSLTPRAPAHAEDAGEAKDAATAGPAANAVASARLPPGPDAKARLATSPENAKRSAFSAVWSGSRDSQPASAQVVTLPPVPTEPAPAGEAPTDAGGAAPELAAAPASILKSGVIEGMAYTLYSDGSIEAELPQGTLRFGSIAALRNHIEESP